jgi:polysaccharide biosynthesis transport protein
LTTQDRFPRARYSWAFVLICIVAGAGAGLAVSATQSKAYKATAQIYPVSDSQVAITDEQVASYAAIARSLRVMRIVGSTLHLHLTPHALSGQVQASVVPNTTLIAITASSSSPKDAARIANATATGLASVVRRLGAGPDTAFVQVQPATRPPSPSRPKPDRALAIGALLGFLAGAGGLLSYRYRLFAR